jgi:single-strand DNA-binding protein
MNDVNRVIISGNLVADPELRHTPSAKAVSDFSVAINNKTKKNDEIVSYVDFIDVTAWGRNAEVCCEYLTKGSSVLIEGRLKQDRWEHEGSKRSRTKVIAEKIQFLGSPRKEESQTKTEKQSSATESSLSDAAPVF